MAGYDYRVNFQDRNRHGLEGEALRSVAQAFSNDNEANKGFFVRRFISATFQISPKNLYDNTQEWLDAFARVEFGEAGLDEVEIFDRLGTRFDMEDEAILLGLGLGLDNVNPNEVKQELHREFHYEEARISRLGFDVAVAVPQKIRSISRRYEWMEGFGERRNLERGDGPLAQLAERNLSDRSRICRRMSRQGFASGFRGNSRQNRRQRVLGVALAFLFSRFPRLSALLTKLPLGDGIDGPVTEVAADPHPADKSPSSKNRGGEGGGRV